MEDLTCKHCGTPITDKFCPSCGQRYLKTPYSKEIIPFLISQTIEFGANYFRTVWTLFVKPNKVVSTFLSGNVKTYVNPLKYLVLTVAVLLIIDWSESFITGDPDRVSDVLEIQVYGVLFVFSIYLILVNKLLWRQFKWVEHIIISPYLAIQMMLIVIISFIPISMMEDWGIIESRFDIAYYAFILMGLYYFYFYISVFHKSKILTFIKSILILLVGIIILAIGMMVLDLVPPVEV